MPRNDGGITAPAGPTPTVTWAGRCPGSRASAHGATAAAIAAMPNSVERRIRIEPAIHLRRHTDPAEPADPADPPEPPLPADPPLPDGPPPLPPLRAGPRSST